jgi:hypothetical protein
MNATVESILRDIVDRYGSALLDDHRRCESYIRDTQLAPKEIAGLVAAVKSGIPARFARFENAGLTAAAVSTYAARLSDETGLREDLARSSLEAWAYALRIDLASRPPPPPPPTVIGTQEVPPRHDSEAKDATALRSKSISAPRPAGLLKRVGYVLYSAIVGVILFTVAMLVFGFVKALLSGSGAVGLASALVFGIAFGGVFGAIFGAVIGKQTAQENGEAASPAADAAGWIVAAIIVIVCLMVLFKN